MSKSATVRKFADPETLNHAKLHEECKRIAREEDIVIYFSQRASKHLSRKATPVGDWLIAQPLKVVSRGQTVYWKAVGDCKELRLELPDAFDKPNYDGTSAFATVKDDAVPGMHYYEAYVDEQLAIGHSSPTVIIDPH